MQDLIKRHFWVVGALTVMVCAIFAGKAVSYLLEASVLGEASEPKKLVANRAPAPTPAAPVKQVRSKDGAQFALRNVFCSECTPAPVVATDPSQIAITTLPLQLIATSIGRTELESRATVNHPESGRGGAYMVGEQLPGASGPIKAIRYQYVDFENAGRIERLMLVGAAPVTTPTVVASADPAPAGDGDELQAAIDAGIKKIDETTYEIDKSLVDKVIANPIAYTKGARVVPAMKNGKAEGIKLYAIRPTSPFAKLGLTNGDTLQSINGFELNSMEKGLELFGKLREATSLEVEVQRRGKQTTLKYLIR